MTFRRVVAPLWGPEQSPVLPFACCVASPVPLLVSLPRLQSPVVGVPGLCWLRWVPFVCACPPPPPGCPPHFTMAWPDRRDRTCGLMGRGHALKRLSHATIPLGTRGQGFPPPSPRFVWSIASVSPVDLAPANPTAPQREHSRQHTPVAQGGPATADARTFGTATGPSFRRDARARRWVGARRHAAAVAVLVERGAQSPRSRGVRYGTAFMC